MDQVAQIRTKVDIVSFISEYISLKKIGRNFTACCPFHNEKSPSFVVSPERQIWHCFGCGKGGDCFTFLMDYENMEFPEALRFLAKKTGIELIEQKGKIETASKKEKIYKLNHLACEFYHFVLTKHDAGKKALDYILDNRKIKEPVIKTFMLGFAPHSGNALSSYLIKKKDYKDKELVDSGLANFRNGKVFDFFINRIIFPLLDHRGNIIGFSGRLFDSSPGQTSSSLMGKYINSRETLVYHKGDVFFGLNIAKESIKKADKAIVMEGEFDVISSFQTGVTNAIAVKGSSLTENQVNLISRFSNKVSLCFDIDAAGEGAIKRSLPILEKKGITTTIILISNGKDPDESIKENPFTFKKAVKEDVNIYDYLISKAISSFNPQTIDGKKKITDEVLPLITLIENEIVKEHYLRKLSKELDISMDALLKQVEKMGKKEINSLIPMSKIKKPRKEILEEYLLALIIQYEDKKKILGKVSNILNEDVFDNLAYKKIFIQFLLFNKDSEFNVEKFLKQLPIEITPAFDKCYLFPLSKFEDETKYQGEIFKVASELKNIFLKMKLKELGERIRDKEKEGEDVVIEKLREEFKELTLLLKN